jgi:hypothetical protein
MAIFDPITFTWKGTDYTVQPDRIMKLLYAIETAVTLPELTEYARNRGGAPVRLSMAYGAALRFAGADVGDDEVYAALFGPDAEATGARMKELVEMAIPPSRGDHAAPVQAEAKKTKATSRS